MDRCPLCRAMLNGADTCRRCRAELQTAQRVERTSQALAGAAIQYAVLANVQLLAEAFRDQPGTGKYQVGMRWIVLPNRFEAYASYGNLFRGSADRWSAIIGIRLQTPEFLP